MIRQLHKQDELRLEDIELLDEDNDEYITPKDTNETLVISIFIKSIMIFSLILLFSSMVLADSDVSGYSIRTHSNDVMQESTTHVFSINVFNNSNGVPINSDISCYLSLYNSSGYNIINLSQDSADSVFNYNFIVPSNNFITGSYVVTYQCNSTNQGGYSNNLFTVTPTGTMLSDADFGLYSILLLFLSAFFIFTLVQLANTNTLVGWKIGFANIGYWVFIVLTFFMWKFTTDYSPSLTYITNILYFVWLIPLLISWIVIPLSIIVLINAGLSNNKKAKLINIGYSEDEANKKVRGR